MAGVKKSGRSTGSATKRSNETMERARKGNQVGGTLVMFGTWMRGVAFGVASLIKPWMPREDGALEGRKGSNE